MLPVIWSLMVSFFFVSMQVFVKLLSSQLSPRYIIAMRSICLLTLNSIIIAFSPNYQVHPPPETESSFSIDIRNSSHLKLMMKRQGLLSLSIVVFLSSL